jgi:streptogramin lyase
MTMRFKPSIQNARFAACATATAFSLLLSGCGLGTSPGVSTGKGSTPLLHISGSIYGGQQPVSGSTIQLYTVGITGPGTASTALISTTVLSGAQGQFAITGDYSCTNGTQVYLTATGGNAGSGNNTSLTMMAALGSCSTLLANASTTFTSMNELTTVAAVFALAPFMTDYTHIGATGSNPTGLVNAFATASALVNPTVGNVAMAPTGITLPTAKLNTLADILASCVNTAGASSSQCTTLFSTTGATDTIGAALAIAKSPGSSAMTGLYALGSASAPFVPAVTSQPNDFTLAINYTGAELASPFGIAIDASGNAWVSNESGASVVKLPHPASTFSTTSFTGSGSLLAPRGVSVDRSGNVWIANTGGNNVVELSSAGSVLSATGYTGGGLSTPVAIANDSAGNAWVANLSGNSVTELGTTGIPSGASPMTASGALAAPTGIALDPTGHVLVANSGSGAVCSFTNAAVFQTCFNDGDLFGATSIAVNSSTIAMAGSTTGTTLNGAFTLATTAGTVNPASPFLGGGLTLPTAVALDGASRTWFANTASISGFSGGTSISPASGYGVLNSPQGIAVDSSGDVWTANAGDNSISVFVGLASPVTTPLSLNVGP